MKESPAYSAVLVRLLKGPLYAEAGEVWDLLLRHRAKVEEWFAQVSLELVVAERDGLAFVRRRREEGDAESEGGGRGDGSGSGPPELVARRELPYLTTLLCVLLVEELYRFETASSDESRLVMDRARIRELALPYLPKKTNEAKQADAIDGQINKLVQYGFLRPIEAGSEELEVTKLLKHKIDAEALTEALAKLSAHARGDETSEGSIDE
ncbi:MAG TPA: DUF4194 domain-containing protein [Rectinemataceae bacterium]|nr:DUF4194 domain-containing protein [Rectinemataceae bacterium]